MTTPAAVDVAVIGAGAAGLAAGRTLADAGVDVLVLEARSRAGGRAWTVTRAGLPLDLGCEWLHSGDRNELTGIARGFGFHVDPSPARWGQQSGDRGFARADQAAFHTASDAFYARMEAAAAAAPPDRPGASQLEPGNRWNGLIGAIGTYINGVEFDRVSVVDYDRYADTGVNWRVREGYGTAIARIGAGLPIRYDTEVTLVDHRGRLMRLETNAGDVTARAVVVTVPPPLMLSERLRFLPALPAKLGAAEGLPLGIANKLMLEVVDPADLPENGHVFGAVDRVGTGSYILRPLGRPYVEGYYAGALADDLERVGPDGFAAFALDELAGLYGADVRRRLIPLVSTAWRAEPFSRGSYSHALPGRADDRAILAAPVDGRLFFAGEATSRHDFSTAHGAYRTGIAAAEAVIATLAAGAP